MPDDRSPIGGLVDERMTAVFAALGDPTRRAILDELGRTAVGTASGLAERLPVSRQAIAKHLGILERAGLVAARPVGREVRYTVEGHRLEQASRWMADRARIWDRRLAEIKRLAERPDDRV